MKFSKDSQACQLSLEVGEPPPQIWHPLPHQPFDSPAYNRTSSPASTLWFSCTQQKIHELSNKNKHISLAFLVTELWTSKVDEHLSSHVPIEMLSMYPFLHSLKLFYIENYLHLGVETFVNSNLFEKKLHRSLTQI